MQIMDGGGPVNSPSSSGTEDQPAKIFECSVCHLAFSHRSSLERHERTHTGEKPYVCKVCKLSFYRPDKLAYHEKVHPGQFTFPCTECSQEFETRAQLRAHKKQHVGVHECETCGKVFTLKRVLTRHKRTHSGEKPFTCEICAKTFTSKYGLQLHKMRHTGLKRFKCEPCNKYFSEKSAISAHKKRVHANERIYECKVCDMQFYQLSEFSKHQRTHLGDKRYECEECAKTFGSRTRLDIHRRTHTGEKPYICEICRKAFTAARYLSVHMSVHSNDELASEQQISNVAGFSQTSPLMVNSDKFKCTVCHVNFKYAFHLKRHMVVHSARKLRRRVSGKKSHDAQCVDSGEEVSSAQLSEHSSHNEISSSGEGCKYKSHSKDIASSSKLSVNEKSHSGDKSFMCKICEKVFTSRGYLNVHMKTHSGVKPFKCEACSKRFSDASAWNSHRKTHTVEKPYKCPSCHVQFSVSKSLDCHRKIHLKEQYNRSMCSTAFMQQQLPKKYRIVDSVEDRQQHCAETQSLMCKDCGKPFAGKLALKKHEDTHAIHKPSLSDFPESPAVKSNRGHEVHNISGVKKDTNSNSCDRSTSDNIFSDVDVYTPIF